tara:strand:- start:280 stop:831 length:552 start_codon:yes stop_codon:yes gene_type:complete
VLFFTFNEITFPTDPTDSDYISDFIIAFYSGELRLESTEFSSSGLNKALLPSLLSCILIVWIDACILQTYRWYAWIFGQIDSDRKKSVIEDDKDLWRRKISGEPVDSGTLSNRLPNSHDVSWGIRLLAVPFGIFVCPFVGFIKSFFYEFKDFLSKKNKREAYIILASFLFVAISYLSIRFLSA